MSIDIRKNIERRIKELASGELTEKALALFSALGYDTSRQSPLTKPTYSQFRDLYAESNPLFNEDKALVKEWKYVDLLFQLSKDEIVPQHGLFDTKQVDATVINAYLFFAIQLKGDSYTRTALSAVTREMNKLFPMPVMVLFLHGGSATLSIINRRLHKRDQIKDVLEKVTLIKDISTDAPHRGHVEILYDLSFNRLLETQRFSNFVELHNAWQKTLDTKELNKRFYQQLASWYFWAKDKVSFPADIEKDEEKRNAVGLIRLITRIVFIWFIKEKNLVPDRLFNVRDIASLLKKFNKDTKCADYYRAILQNLFFGTLNQKMEDRAFAKNGTLEENRNEYGIKNRYRYAEAFAVSEKEAVKLFAGIPFLNGGLFDCLDKPDDRGKVQYSDGFSRNPRKQAVVPDYLFFGPEQDCDLNEVFGTKGKRYKVRGLIELLSSYKFTVTENTPLEEEVALDPELLGKVFENLLASYNPETQTTARKQTGSFYTPREIVNYMVDEALVAYFKSVLLGKTAIYNELGHAQTSMFGNEVKKGQLSLTDELSGSPWKGKEIELESALQDLLSYTTGSHSFSEHDVDILVNAIDSCKILDPACGSGAFPMGVLHKLVHVIHKLDPRNARWKRRQIGKAKHIEDPSLRDKAIADIEEAFESNDLDYGRKLFLIENCIYGIDIQPIAVQIAKLRFFISLIIDERPKPEKENLGIRSLPNLETKFVAADSLIGIDKPKEGEIAGGDLFRNPEIPEIEKELKEIRHGYFSAKTRKEKLDYQRQDKALRERLAAALESSGWDEDTARVITSFDPYDQNRSAPFFDSEWMFGLRQPDASNGVFDVVIGNPPYVQIQNFSGRPEQAAWAKQGYQTFTKTGDVYCLFYEEGFRLLRKNGVLSYITSNKWMRANYGKQLRAFFTENTRPQVLIDFGSIQVFESATVDTTIFIGLKGGAGKPMVTACTMQKEFAENGDLGKFVSENGVTLTHLGADSWLISSPDEASLRKRIEEVGTPLKDWDIAIYRGILTGFNEAFIIDGKKKDELIAEDPKSAEILKPILSGRDLKRYLPDWPGTFLVATHNGYGTGKAVVPPVDVKKSYPSVYKYFDKFGKAIASGQLKVRGKGLYDRDDQGSHWSNLRDCAYFAEFKKEKIVYADVMRLTKGGERFPRFAFSTEEQYFTNTVFMITGESLRYLLAVLNSYIGHYFINLYTNRFDATGFRMFTVFVEQFPIPKISTNRQLPFEILVDCILFAKSHNLDTEATLFESVIDSMVFDLYFPEEMKKAHCYITDRVAEVVKPFKKSDSNKFKTEYIQELYKFFKKDKIVYHGLIHRRTVKPVEIVMGAQHER